MCVIVPGMLAPGQPSNYPQHAVCLIANKRPPAMPTTSLCCFSDFSDSETIEGEDLHRILGRKKLRDRRTSYGSGYSCGSPQYIPGPEAYVQREDQRKGIPPYRRSHSLAEIQHNQIARPQPQEGMAGICGIYVHKLMSHKAPDAALHK